MTLVLKLSQNNPGEELEKEPVFFWETQPSCPHSGRHNHRASALRGQRSGVRALREVSGYWDTPGDRFSSCFNISALQGLLLWVIVSRVNGLGWTRTHYVSSFSTGVNRPEARLGPGHSRWSVYREATGLWEHARMFFRRDLQKICHSFTNTHTRCTKSLDRANTFTLFLHFYSSFPLSVSFISYFVDLIKSNKLAVGSL